MAGNISTPERQRRMKEIAELSESGLTNSEIADKTGLPIATVLRNLTYMREESLFGLDRETIEEKRLEFDVIHAEQEKEAKAQYLKYKDKNNKEFLAARWFKEWVIATTKWAAIWGLENVKLDFTQINTQNNTYIPESNLTEEQMKKIAKVITEDL